MKKINALLIDDETSALKTLKGMLQHYFPQVNILETALSVNDAYQKVTSLQPDLIFLDIEMPPFGSGFDLLNRCGDYTFGVIFTTAYPKYAVQAINDIQPWAYLIKPFSVNDLERAIETAEEKLRAKRSEAGEEGSNSHLVLPDARKGNIIIPVSQIIYCKADGATADIFYKADKKITCFSASRTLKDLESQLSENIFCRCHHSYLVNLIFVERFEQTGRNGIVHLKNKDSIPVSVSKMEYFTERLYAYLNKKT
ncbi:MAG: LytTR family DNA-binding domain-containing protein [Bacteroidota bacterium]